MRQVDDRQINVVVVDKYPATRLGIKLILDSEEDMLIIGEADSAEEALRLANETSPDVIVLDLELKGEENGTELCRKMKSRPNPPGVVIYTVHNATREMISCRLRGADSYVHKGEETNKLLEAVRETYSGKSVWFLGSEKEPTTSITSLDQSILTPREKEVFALILENYTNAQIAKELSISAQTAKNYSSKILRKLGVRRRADLP